MGLQETQLDVLLNIECAVLSVYRDRPTLLDYAIMKALDALIEIYRAESRGHAPKEISLKGEEKKVLDRVRQVCEWRMDRDDSLEHLTPPLTEARTLNVMQSCLRKIRRSLDKWSTEEDRGGIFSSYHSTWDEKPTRVQSKILRVRNRGDAGHYHSLLKEPDQHDEEGTDDHKEASTILAEAMSGS